MIKTEFENWLNTIRSYGIKPGLSRIRVLLDRLGQPQNKLDIIHITGTNGKGTTATVLRGILQDAGYTVGQFSTPSIISFNHMFYTDGPIKDEDLYGLADRIKCICDDMVLEGLDHPTEYEIIAAMMYLHFYECHVDFAVVEVAMGGEHDCTNVMDHSILSIITPISLDHVGFLGDTLLDIAKEKSGVIKNNSVAICHPQTEEVSQYLLKDCEQKWTKYITFKPLEGISYDQEMIFEYKGLSIQTSLLGIHQANNIIGVIEAVNTLNTRGYTSVTQSSMIQSIANTAFEGRFERIDRWVLDGAHNHASLMALKDVLELTGMNQLTGVFAALVDKDIDDALIALRPFFKRIIVTEADNPRKMKAHDMKERLDRLGYNNIVVETSIKKAFEIAETEDSIKLGFGSFYMISDLRQQILKVH